MSPNLRLFPFLFLNKTKIEQSRSVINVRVGFNVRLNRLSGAAIQRAATSNV